VADPLGNPDLVPPGVLDHDPDPRWPRIPVGPTIYISDKIQNSSLSAPTCFRSFLASRDLSGSRVLKVELLSTTLWKTCEEMFCRHLDVQH
jgi:hypothetical protein